MSKRFSLTFALLGCGVLAPACRAITLPAQTTIPVIFTHTVDSARAKAGDVVTAKTMQVVLLPNGDQLPKGTLVTGHVVEARAFKFDETPYATQQASYLSIQIDQILDKGVSSPVATSVRALASAQTVEEALTPQRMDETDSLGMMVAGRRRALLPSRQARNGWIRRRYRRLQQEAGSLRASPSWGLGCEGTQTEQSVAIFSPDACGLYGFVSVHLSAKGDGTFRLESTHHTIKLYAGSAALLQVQ